ncbi:hypothetical protein ACFL59_03475 [Planctomycetota bacterium]
MELLQREFVAAGFDGDYELHVIAQQRFLYLEVAQRNVGGNKPGRRAARSSRTPLGRLQYCPKTPAEWELHRYKWSDEYWDSQHDIERGGLDELLMGMLVSTL